MNLTSRGKLYLLIGVLSFIFSYLIVTLNFFPHLGFAISFLIFILLSYKFKKERTKDSKIFLAFALLFPVMLFVRSEPLITFLNFGASFFFGLMVLTPPLKKDLGFLDIIYKPINFVIKTFLSGKSDYFLEFKDGSENSKAFKVGETVFGILITVLLLVLVLPLLSSANPLFQNIVESTLSLFNLDNLLKQLGFENILVWLLRLVLFLLFIFLIPKALTLMNKSEKYILPFSLKNENLPLTIQTPYYPLIL